ncbi:hypothetical protein DP113_24760 [Brasilonema octagenarum UFV-E1]|uniref:Uncharacterized protein n=1 Tax=Brasilonema sennae CENA114 TaxID=415709 RepID=A0A856MME8_9CYAN|nr:hypothetical protein [Brasilonema sennae]QDL10701.1 hypothetical protein DP114_24860 [Brasilonema sennae CENA114]QDL17045.1 hypothetical protein DP113_24760 [Brasilonema octagenarum UFV-E1]
MQPNDIISITAFLNALAKLNESLPADIQKQLHAIAENLKANPNNIGNLDVIAESYPPLDEAYQQELTALKQEAGIRSKGLPPLPLPNERNQELTNSAIDTFSAEDSVAAAKAKRNLLQRLWQLISRSR